MQDGWPRRQLLFVPGENPPAVWKELISRLRLAHLTQWVDRCAPLRDCIDRLSQLARGSHTFHVVACGGGCDLAVSFALQFPQAVTSLVLVDPAGTGAQGEIETSGQLERLMQWLQLGHGPSVRDEQHLKLLKAKVAEQTLSGWDLPGHAAASDDLLEALTCPLLVLLGSAAAPAAKAVTAAKYGQAPRFQLRLVSGASACCVSEAPEAVLSMALDFMGAKRDIA